MQFRPAFSAFETATRLRYYDDLAVSDVAAVLGCTEGTVKSQTARGLETLQAAFARETNDDLLVSGRE